MRMASVSIVRCAQLRRGAYTVKYQDTSFILPLKMPFTVMIIFRRSFGETDYPQMQFQLFLVPIEMMLGSEFV